MLQFHPPGMGQQIVETSLGEMVYYVPVGTPWVLPPPDAQPLVFLHNFGGGASAYEWSKVYPAFLDSYRVIAPDLIGWGRSAHLVREYRVEDYLVTLTEFLEKTCGSDRATTVHRPAIVIASSLTGAIALRLAGERPDLFKALCLVCPSGFADLGQDAGRRLPLQAIGMPLLDQMIYSIGAMNEVAVRSFLERFLFAKPSRVSPEMVAAYLESAKQPNAQYAALAFLRGDLYFDLANYVPQLKIPTMILWGENAQFITADLGQRVARLNPTYIQEFVKVPSAGVLLSLEQPALTIGMLQQFLSKH
ncbi:alpha/beta hydrolase [Phormidium sp. CLA17]|uniref:alpha/beta fold hydrolase n=1 Tax=Leptolyngbya sp. Cla-17 TaxID=2803751 RepID=UPI001490E616|nr:alpha/beta hydrolase [Leptolyngbya sp. Cla-17]MBM0743883.1 alpha/beta hydrolase [Leptolyngbya sp. Cla-17]